MRRKRWKVAPGLRQRFGQGGTGLRLGQYATLYHPIQNAITGTECRGVIAVRSARYGRLR